MEEEWELKEVELKEVELDEGMKDGLGGLDRG